MYRRNAPAWIAASFVVFAGMVAPVACAEVSEGDSEPPPRAHVLAVAGLRGPSELADPNRVCQQFEGLVIEQLEAAGFRVIPPEQFQPVWRAVADSIGALEVGKTVPSGPQVPPLLCGRASEVRKRVKELSHSPASAGAARTVSLGRVGADAIVEPQLLLTYEPLEKGTMAWYGARVDVRRGEDARAMYAYSLRIVITHANDSMLHTGTGGIEAASSPVVVREKGAYVPGGGAQITGSLEAHMGREMIKAEKLFRNEARNRHAVRFALTPFAASEAAQK